MRDHYKESENLTPAAFNTIDWDTIKDSTNSSPELFNLWMSKQVSGFCPVGKNMQQWGFWEDSKCHSYNEPSEDANHFCFCPHEDRQDERDEAAS
jgi:hypothetical protein